MDKPSQHSPSKFGAVIGISPGNVQVYSLHYASADDAEFPSRQAYRSNVDGVYMGYKWQCVDFARRWPCLSRGYVFDDIDMAYDIFRLRSVRRIRQYPSCPVARDPSVLK